MSTLLKGALTVDCAMTDHELQQAVANWLPAKIVCTAGYPSGVERFFWLGSPLGVPDIAWLGLVHLAEKQLSDKPKVPGEKSESTLYREALCVETVMEGGPIVASWQHRVRALLKVRGGA